MTQPKETITAGYQDEIVFQKQMLHNLQRWQSLLSMVVGIGVLMMYFFRQQNVWLLGTGIALTVIGILLILTIGYGIYHGKKNLEVVIRRYGQVMAVKQKY